MWIEKFEVTGFLGNDKVISLEFHPDLNILTGRNGAGKTSIMKLMWYIQSGNILEALREVEFQKAALTTNEYTCTVYRLSRATCKVEFKNSNETIEFEDIEDDDGNVYRNAEDAAAEILIPTGKSVFFPTFRRIEGGFTMNSLSNNLSVFARRTAKAGPVEEALNDLSAKLSNGSHRFIAAISTVDIVNLLQKTYTDLSEESDQLRAAMSSEIIETITSFQQTGEGDDGDRNADDVLKSIRQRIENVEESRTQVMRPIGEVQRVVRKIFRHKGIKFGRLSFGDAAQAINSDLLSAGEKQMLSFLSYNGLNSECTIFIDEPELSLHVDWQRNLFLTLQRQQSSNQFIIATHSPFIYTKYPDKEIPISHDRGDLELEV
ncbi:AAA family ATPase [Novosphingobium sp.]|uniref:AAA family ATPase n=1 Tax=Novosphingobium sp. TaxID=1874826 RepID=UPI003BAB0F73